ncbi:hypothetical protein DPMN_073894 [Dreissena polymorpha]|uniref:Uncharacterized protein n=1 Tax=Dreissena polymorpha TaxID=45954 RepID=A0A9D3YHM4_DREPO|nr:hypothetical protein DPMN_073894 [Dreissena polymorpha]
MARQKPRRGCGRGTPGLVMGPCIVEIDRIVKREVKYQLEVNRCRNEEVIVKGNYGWVWPMWAGRPRIDRIVIREVQYQLEVYWCRNEEFIVKGNFGWVWHMWAGRPRIDRIVIREVQYQFEVNRCSIEEIIVKGYFGWVWSYVGGVPRIDRIVIKEVQYQFEVNLCRNEEIIVKGNFGWVWSMWAGHPRIDIRDVQYHSEVNQWLVMRPCIVEIDSIVKTEVQYQFEPHPNPITFDPGFQGSSAYRLTDRQTDGQTPEITTISPRFSKRMGIMKI